MCVASVPQDSADKRTHDDVRRDPHALQGSSSHAVPRWLVVRWGEGLTRRSPVRVVMRDVNHHVSVKRLTEVTRIVAFWEGSLILGISVFGVRLDMVIFKALLSVLGTTLPILLTRLAAQWTGDVF